MMGAGGGGPGRILERRRVLVVEDEALVGLMIGEDLRDAGAAAIGPAATLAEGFRLARAALADGGLDAAVLDANLGGESVLPLADLLGAHGVPFVFATGYGETVDRGTHAAAPVLDKPFASDALIEALHAVITGRWSGGRSD